MTHDMPETSSAGVLQSPDLSPIGSPPTYHVTCIDTLHLKISKSQVTESKVNVPDLQKSVAFVSHSVADSISLDLRKALPLNRRTDSNSSRNLNMSLKNCLDLDSDKALDLKLRQNKADKDVRDFFHCRIANGRVCLDETDVSASELRTSQMQGGKNKPRNKLHPSKKSDFFKSLVSSKELDFNHSQQPPCLFAIQFDNISVHLIMDKQYGLPVFLIAYTNELETLSLLSIREIQAVKRVCLQEPVKGIIVLLAVDNAQVTVSGPVYQRVLTVEKAALDSDSFQSREDFLKLKSHNLMTPCRPFSTDAQSNESDSGFFEEDKNLLRPFGKWEDTPSFVSCLLCLGEHVHGLCVLTNPTHQISDCKNCLNSHIQALSSLPYQFCLVRCVDRLTVSAAESIQWGTLIGPLQGEPISFEQVKRLKTLKDIWILEEEETRQVAKKERFSGNGQKKEKHSKLDCKTENSLLLTTESETHSNWCRYFEIFLSL